MSRKYEVPDPWRSRVKAAAGRAMCKVFGHPPLAKWQPKMYGRICPRCGTYRGRE